MKTFKYPGGNKVIMYKLFSPLIVLLLLFVLIPSVDAQVKSTFIKEIHGEDFSPYQEIPVEFIIENQNLIGTEMFVEACIQPKGMALSMSLNFFPMKNSCCPGNYWCDGGRVTLAGSLSPLNKETIKLKPRVPSSTIGAMDNCGNKNYWGGEGQYEIILRSVDVCCTGPTGSPSCSATQPYGWGQVIKVINVKSAPSPPPPPPPPPPSTCGNTACDSGETPENCPSDCPIIPPNPYMMWLEANWMIAAALIFITIGAVVMVKR